MAPLSQDLLNQTISGMLRLQAEDREALILGFEQRGVPRERVISVLERHSNAWTLAGEPARRSAPPAAFVA